MLKIVYVLTTVSNALVLASADTIVIGRIGLTVPFTKKIVLYRNGCGISEKISVIVKKYY